MKRIKTSNYPRGRRGAVLVEAALVTTTIVLPLLLGIIQFGLFYYATNSLTQATREGARYAAVYGMRTDLTDAYIKDHVIERGQAGNITIEPGDITITPDKAARTQYTQVTVQVTYDMNKKKIMPIWLPSFVYTPGNVTRTSTSMLE